MDDEPTIKSRKAHGVSSLFESDRGLVRGGGNACNRREYADSFGSSSISWCSSCITNGEGCHAVADGARSHTRYRSTHAFR